MILRAGLTGGIASGKSTIARNFAALGCTTVDADAVVADLYRPGRPGHEALVRNYGGGILRIDGEVDRQKLSDIAFSSSEAAARLNALIHPIVLEEESRLTAVYEAAAHDDRIVVIEATLLLEAGGKGRYDRIVVVDIQPELQIKRGVARGMAQAEVQRRLAHQMPREQRLALADYVIDNSGDMESGLRETQRVYDALVKDLEAKKRAS